MANGSHRRRAWNTRRQRPTRDHRPPSTIRCDNGTCAASGSTETMSGTSTKLTAAVQEYFADLRRVRASGTATPERSLYGPLGDLLKAVGATLKPKVFCIQEPADLGAGHPDFGLYAAKQVQKGAPRAGQTPERGVVEVKSPADDAWLTAAGRQATRYWGRYRLVLVTNARDFVLVGETHTASPRRSRPCG